MELAAQANNVVLLFSVFRIVQPGESQKSPYEISSRPYYIRKVPQLAGHTKNLPRLCAASTDGPMVV